MTIYNKMKKVTLQSRVKTQSPSGQIKYDYIDSKDIEVAIYPANYTILTSNNIKYAESTNTGLTTEKDIQEVVNRINDNGDIYEITFANPIRKYTQLYLKKVEYHE